MQLFVDQLTNIDFSYLDPQRGLLGETWLADVVLEGALDQQNMVWDFGLVKKSLRHWLDSEMDHRLLIPTLSPHLSLSEVQGQLDIRWQLANGDEIRCVSPSQAVARVEAESISADSVARWARAQLRSVFPDSVSRIQLDFRHEAIDAPYYHYSHGLKKHAGNCQRIAHGHRSRIQIWKDGERSAELEQHWARLWADIYLGSEDDLLSSEQGRHHFAYQAPQGSFELWLPQQSVYTMGGDTTVELIAQHIAERLKAAQPQARFRVKAFEGIGKGALVEI